VYQQLQQLQALIHQKVRAAEISKKQLKQHQGNDYQFFKVLDIFIFFTLTSASDKKKSFSMTFHR
jgi:hypothetical protein